MSEGRVVFERAGAVGTITFDRPAARNAMTPQMYEALEAICHDAAADPALRIVVLRGAGGRSFASGSDIAQFLDFTSGDDGVAYERRMEQHLAAIEAIPVPTLAVIEGMAVGGGLNIAARCDLRIATAGSRIGVPIARSLGNCLSAANYARLILGFGEGRARRMLLLGDMLEAEEALAAGFLSRVVPAEALEEEIAAVTGQFLANAPLSMKASKAAVNRLAADASAEIEDLIRSAYGSGDFRDAVRAFFAKEKPTWRGE